MIKRMAVGALITTSAFAQSQAVEEKMKAEAQHTMMTVYSVDSAQVSTLTGAPYSAEETNTTTQTLFDGNRIVNTSTTKVYRDAQGRTRVERNLGNIGAVPAGQPSVSVTINDPVAGVRYSVDSASKTAFKSESGGTANQAEMMVRLKKLADEKQATARTEARTEVRTTESGTFTFTTAANGTTAFKFAPKREDLGASNMAGVPVTGSKTTTVIPAGAMGNDRDITMTEERWYSPDLKMNIMTKHSDPRMGETVFQVNNLTRANPDPSLFQVPSDYTTKEGPRPGVRIMNDMIKE
jgi:hypothetical protein